MTTQPDFHKTPIVPTAPTLACGKCARPFGPFESAFTYANSPFHQGEKGMALLCKDCEGDFFAHEDWVAAQDP